MRGGTTNAGAGRDMPGRNRVLWTEIELSSWGLTRGFFGKIARQNRYANKVRGPAGEESCHTQGLVALHIQYTAFHPCLSSSYNIVHVVGPLPERPSQCSQYATKPITSTDLASFPVLASPFLPLWTSRLYATNSLQMLSCHQLHQLPRRSPPGKHAPTC